MDSSERTRVARSQGVDRTAWHAGITERVRILADPATSSSRCRLLAEGGRTTEHIVHELELLDFNGEIPSPFQLNVAIPSADPDDQGRRFELSSFEIVSKESGATIGKATVTHPLEGDADEGVANDEPAADSGAEAN